MGCVDLTDSPLPFPPAGQWVGCVDLAPNEEADVNVLVKPSDSWEDQTAAVVDGVEGALAGEKLDAIFCVAGGWAGGNAEAKSECRPPLGRWRWGL